MSDPLLFPVVEPPVGGLFRLRRRLKDHRPSTSARLLRLWPALAVVAVVVVAVRTTRPPTEYLGAPIRLPAGAVAVVDDLPLVGQPLPSGALFVWLPPR